MFGGASQFSFVTSWQLKRDLSGHNWNKRHVLTCLDNSTSLFVYRLLATYFGRFPDG